MKSSATAEVGNGPLDSALQSGSKARPKNSAYRGTKIAPGPGTNTSTTTPTIASEKLEPGRKAIIMALKI